MTRLTNISAQFISEVHKEISTPPLNDKLIVYYENISSIGDSKFAVFIFKNLTNDRFRIFKKQWNIEDDPYGADDFDWIGEIKGLRFGLSKA